MGQLELRNNAASRLRFGSGRVNPDRTRAVEISVSSGETGGESESSQAACQACKSWLSAAVGRLRGASLLNPGGEWLPEQDSNLRQSD